MPAKAKAKKVQGEFARAFACGGGTQETCSDNGVLPTAAVPKSSCSFTGGKFKVQTGKDASVQILGLNCGLDPVPANICVRVRAFTTIMDEDIDKDGVSTPETCTLVVPLEGKSAFSNTAAGTIACDTSKGKCKGTVPNVAADPCPDVDKNIEVRAVEVFDGPTFTLQQPIPGIFLGDCKDAGGVEVDDVMASPGQMTQGL
jgi:hypothetical protein